VSLAEILGLEVASSTEKRVELIGDYADSRRHILVKREPIDLRKLYPEKRRQIDVKIATTSGMPVLALVV